MKYVARFLWFVVKKAIVVMLVVWLCYLSFSIASDIANTYITLKEGMQARVDVVFKKSETADLSKFFTRNFLDEDKVLRSNTYTDFEIQTYDYKLEIKQLWVWSWRNEGEATVIERVPTIVGELPEILMTDEEKAAGKNIDPPQWQAVEYTVTLVRDNGWWRIDEIISQEPVPEPSPTPTFFPTPTPSDYSTATPALAAVTPLPTVSSGK